MEEFSLINMNGRLYDPVLGLFLSPDKFVPSVENSHAFNRYSYCLNNPLMYTDPDGNNPATVIAIGSILYSGLSAGMYSEFSNGDFWGGFGKGLLMGSITAGIGYGAGALGNMLTNSLGASPIAIGLVSGGLGFLGGGIASMITTGKWDWTSAVMSGLIAGVHGYENAPHQIKGAFIGKRFVLDVDYSEFVSNESPFFMCPADLNSVVALNKDGSIPYNNENAREFYNKVFAGTYSAKKGLSQIYADGRLGSTLFKGRWKTVYYFEQKGVYISKGTEALGIASCNPSTRSASIYLGSKCFKSSMDLFLTLGHELTHVALNYYGLPNYEAYCFNWQYNVATYNNLSKANYYMNQSLKDWTAIGGGPGWMNTPSTSKFPNFGIPFKF